MPYVINLRTELKLLRAAEKARTASGFQLLLQPTQFNETGVFFEVWLSSHNVQRALNMIFSEKMVPHETKHNYSQQLCKIVTRTLLTPNAIGNLVNSMYKYVAINCKALPLALLLLLLLLFARPRKDRFKNDLRSVIALKSRQSLKGI
jgi:hypothetical protein